MLQAALKILVDRARNRNQLLNTLLAEAEATCKENDNKPPVYVHAHANITVFEEEDLGVKVLCLYDTLITEYEFFLVNLVRPYYYKEGWVGEEEKEEEEEEEEEQGRGPSIRCLMAEFVGEMTRGEKKLVRWLCGSHND